VTKIEAREKDRR
jgi:hypothetical protein